MIAVLLLTALAAAAAPPAVSSPPPEPPPAGSSNATRPSGDEDAAELPEGAVASVDGVPITLERYKEHLLRVYGLRELDQLVALVLLEREAARLGIGLTEEELDAGVAAELELAETRLGGPDALSAALGNEGLTVEQYARSLREGVRRGMLADRICRARREITPRRLQEEFERLYGPDGLTTNVQHVWLTLQRGKLELESQGKGGEELSRENVYAHLMERGAALAGRVAAGEELEAVARAESHDPTVDRNGGYLTGYEFTRLSRDLIEPLAEAPLGEFVGPLRTANGVFLFRVLSRTRTRFEDVEDEVARSLREQPATPLEMRALEAELYGAADIRKR